MAGADFNAPFIAVNLNLIVLLYPLIGLRQRMNMLAETTKTRAIALQRFLTKTGGAVETKPFFGNRFTGITGHGAAHQIIGARHMKISVEMIDQPTGKPDMVGVHMGDDDFMNRPAAHKTGKQIFPMRARTFHIDACINNHPAIAVAQQPDIDMVERIGQIHTHPKNPIGDLNWFAQLRFFIKRIAQAMRLRRRFYVFGHYILNACKGLAQNLSLGINILHLQQSANRECI